MSNTTEIASPCNNICSLNEQNICVGCYRSLEEIACWGRASDFTKLEILENIAQRAKSVPQ